MVEDDKSQVETELGSQFWAQPEEALQENFRFVYAQVLAPLRELVRERQGNVIDYMLVERLAFQYAMLRQREQDETNELQDRNRREMNKDWLDFTLTLKKLWFSEDKTNRDDVLAKKMEKAMYSSIKDMPADSQRQVTAALADIMDAVGI